MRTASQNDGVAMHAMENTRMIWSGHRSRYSAETTPRITATTTPMMRPKNVSWSVTGSACADALGHGGVVRAVGAQVALGQAHHVVAVLHEDRVVQPVVLAILLDLRLGRVLSQDRIRLVDGRERHDEEYEDGDTEYHDRQRYEAPSDHTQQVAHRTLLSLLALIGYVTCCQLPVLARKAAKPPP